MAGPLFYLVALVTLFAALVRAYRLRTSGVSPAGLGYVLLLGALALTFCVMAPPSQALVNRYVPDLFKLVGNCGTLVAAFAATLVTLFTARPSWRNGRAVLVRLGGLLIALATLVLMFFLPHPVVLTGSFDGYLDRDPTLVGYTLVYSVYLGVALVDITVGLWRFSRHSEGYLRRGLLVMALGGVAGIGYVLAKILVVVQHLALGSASGTGDASGVCHAAFSSVGCAVAVGAPAISGVLLCCGVLLATVAVRLDTSVRRRGYRKSVAALTPLWSALCSAFPDIASDTGDTDVYLVLSRRLIEVRDGLLLLAPYRRPEFAAEAERALDDAAITGAQRAALGEAMQIAAALDNRAADPDPAPPVFSPIGSAEVDAETRQLTVVADAFATSPAVAKFRTERTPR